MKPNQIACTTLLSLLFGMTAAVPCLPLQQDEKHKKDQGDQNKQTQIAPQQRRAQEQPPPISPPQSVPQAKPQPAINNAQQHYQHVDRGHQDRTQQRQPTPQSPQDRSGPNHSQQPDTRDQDSQHRQDFDKNRSRPPFDQQHGRRDRDNRDGRDYGRTDHHHGNRHDHPNDWQGLRARDWRSDHRTWEQRGGYRGYRIPEYRFGRYFGPRHFFRIHDLPVLVFNGNPRFLYGGYWFSLVDPWPEYWAEDWFETDDVFIAYTADGFYLFNRRYPDVGIAVSISG